MGLVGPSSFKYVFTITIGQLDRTSPVILMEINRWKSWQIKKWKLIQMWSNVKLFTVCWTEALHGFSSFSQSCEDFLCLQLNQTHLMDDCQSCWCWVNVSTQGDLILGLSRCQDMVWQWDTCNAVSCCVIYNGKPIKENSLSTKSHFCPLFPMI